MTVKQRIVDKTNVNCPNCNILYALDESYLGKKIQCSECGTKFYIKESDRNIIVQAEVVCPKCNTEYPIDSNNVGQKTKCENCGTNFRFELNIKKTASPRSSVPTLGAPAVLATSNRGKKIMVGKRQRMYLFERAYIDYATRFRNFGRGLKDICASIWDWFWEGSGSNVIETILRICVVVSGIAFGILYVLYERDHGRSFSVGTFFAFCLIAVYVSVLMWGWKAPVHIASRAASGVVASGSIAVLGALVLTSAFLVFSIYLIGLFTLTALSFLVFIPMGFTHWLWLLYRRITYCCPYDDCGYYGLPIHICSCGQQYDDLKPSFYGIFHHTCRHDSKDVKLPTMNFLGRNKLTRLCGGCKRPLIFSSTGELSERPIAIIGGPGTGKTVFLRQAVRQLIEHLRSFPHSKVCIDSINQQKELDNDLKLLDSGQVLDKTAGDIGDEKMRAFGIAVRIPNQMRDLLYIYDAPGEHFETIREFGKKQAIQHLGGMLLLVDPFSLPALSNHARHLSAQLKVSKTPLDQVVQVLVNGVNMMLVKQSTDKCNIPLAVVLGKADALPTNDFLFLDKLCSGDGHLDGENIHRRCREALEQLGQGHCIRLLEQKFTKVRYFACSALGRMPDLHNTRPFQPMRVVEPFLWLMGLDKNTMGEVGK